MLKFLMGFEPIPEVLQTFILTIRPREHFLLQAPLDLNRDLTVLETDVLAVTPKAFTLTTGFEPARPISPLP